MTEQTKDLQQRAEAFARLALDVALADRDRLQALNAELVAHLAFAVKILDGIPAIAGTAQVDAMRSALKKARGE